MVYYQQHLNVNRLWLEQIMYEVCLQVRHIVAMCCQGLFHCQIYIDEFAVVQDNTCTYNSV